MKICNDCHGVIEEFVGHEVTKCSYCGSTSLRNPGMGEYGAELGRSTTEDKAPLFVAGVFVVIALCAIIYFLPQIATSTIKAWLVWAVISLVSAAVVAWYVGGFGGYELSDFPEATGSYLTLTAIFTAFLIILKVLIILGYLGYRYLSGVFG